MSKFKPLFKQDNPRRFRRWHGTYRKEFYEVKLATGEVVHCWPNAGRMIALDDSGREWAPSDNINVRLAEEAEL